jgi:hypothetical protein
MQVMIVPVLLAIAVSVDSDAVVDDTGSMVGRTTI